MTSLADRTIAALRDLHDDLAALVPTLSDAQLSGPSGAAEWPLAQVFSHLGSGAEISLATHAATLAGTDAPDQATNESIWDRWNAMTSQEQAAGFVSANGALVAWFEALTPEQRETVEINLSFLPFPLPLAASAGMRL